MQPRHPARDHRLAAILLACALAAFRPAIAQPPEPPTPPTLDDILVHLESNLNQYDSQVPSFLCDEHVVSQILPTHTQQTVTESVFRLKRTVDAHHKSILDESRDIKTVNGYPAKGDDLNGPSVLSGAFSGGLAVVSLNQEGCMSYKLRPIKPGHPNDPYVVQFTSTDQAEHRPDCLLQETGSGRVFIDPATMQIKRMELIAPRHVLTFGGTTPDGRPIPPAIGVWQISVDYAPIQLGGRTFWMPTTIQSNMTALPNTWVFEARYSNYHKLEVTTRILPSTEDPK